MKVVVLDACALVAYMCNEKGALFVKKQINDPQIKLMIHVVNFYQSNCSKVDELFAHC